MCLDKGKNLITQYSENRTYFPLLALIEHIMFPLDKMCGLGRVLYTPSSTSNFVLYLCAGIKECDRDGAYACTRDGRSLTELLQTYPS